MKPQNHETAEIIVIAGVFLLLACCIVAEVIRGEAVDLTQIINALAIILTGVSGHLFGSKSALKQAEPPKGENT